MNNISDLMHNKLSSLPAPVMMEVLLEAIDIMQAWNGATHTACIAQAMGATGTETDTGTVWALPSNAAICESFGYKVPQ
jgi:hypothetical protein